MFSICTQCSPLVLQVFVTTKTTGSCFTNSHFSYLYIAKVEAGLPTIGPPPFEAEYNNHTANFWEMTSHLGSGIFVVPLIAIVGNMAIAKAFGKYY